MAFSAAMSCAIHQRVVDGRHRVLPDELFLGHKLAEVAGARAHVAVRQLEPGAREGVGKGLRVLVEAARNLLVGGVHAQRQVGRGHHRRVLLRRVVRIRDHVFGLAVLGHPLVRAGRALDQFPLVAEQHVEVTHVPLGGVGLPRAFDAAGRGVHPLAGAERVLPAQALFLDGRAFGLGANELGVAGAMRLAEGVAAGDERDGFFVVHRHAREGLAHVAAGGHRVGVAVRAFGVDVDQAHLHGGQRVRQFTRRRCNARRRARCFRGPSGCLARAPTRRRGRRRSRRS